MSEEGIKKVGEFSGTTKEAIRKKSAQYLPNSPTGRGFTPEKIKAAFYTPLVDATDSIVSEIDRIVGDVNDAFDAEKTDRENAIAEEKTDRENADNALNNTFKELSSAIETVSAREDERERLRDAREEAMQAATEESLEEMRTALSEGLSGKLDRVAGEHFAVYGESPSGAKLYPLEDETCGEYSVVQRDRYGRICAAAPVSTSPDAAVINKGYLEGALQKVNEAIKEGDDALRGAVAGKTASFVIEDAEMLEALLSGAWSVGGSSFDTSVLGTGDNVFIIDVDLPDLWFEATNDLDRVAETITVKDADGAEREIVLDVKGYQTGSRIGLLHVLEGAKHVSVDLEALGDVDTALDAILEIQNALIGGASA